MFNNVIKILMCCFNYLCDVIKHKKKLNNNVIKMGKNNVSEKNSKKEINKFTFILFAEFVGYESPFIEWAEQLGNGEKLEEFQIKLIERDADYIFKEMLKEFEENDIKEWFYEFYEILLKDYDVNINKNIQLSKI
jgi:hypothetical protein